MQYLLLRIRLCQSAAKGGRHQQLLELFVLLLMKFSFEYYSLSFNLSIFVLINHCIILCLDQPTYPKLCRFICSFLSLSAADPEAGLGLVPVRFILRFQFQVKRNLQTNGFEVDNDLIRETWHPVYRKNFLTKALSRCHDCRRGFYIYNQGVETDVRYGPILLNYICCN